MVETTNSAETRDYGVSWHVGIGFNCSRRLEGCIVVQATLPFRDVSNINPLNVGDVVGMDLATIGKTDRHGIFFFLCVQYHIPSARSSWLPPIVPRQRMVKCLVFAYHKSFAIGAISMMLCLGAAVPPRDGVHLYTTMAKGLLESETPTDK